MTKHQLEHRNRQQRQPVAIVRDLAPQHARTVVGGWSVPEYGGSPETVTKTGRNYGDYMEIEFKNLRVSSYPM